MLLAQILHRPSTEGWPAEAVIAGSLEQLAIDPTKLYSRSEVSKRNGKMRVIEAPEARLKFLQSEINEQLLSRASLAPGVYGFRRGISGGAYGGLRRMLSNLGEKNDGTGDLRAVFSTDITDFFPSVTQAQATEALNHFFFRILERWKKGPTISEEERLRLADIVARLCCIDGRLPQGAPTSPAIANMVGSQFDRPIQESLTQELGDTFEYGRYADDIVIMSVDSIGEKQRRLVQAILASQGFKTSHAKTEYHENEPRYGIWGTDVFPRYKATGETEKDRGLRFKLPAKLDRAWAKELLDASKNDSLPKHPKLFEVNSRFKHLMGNLSHAHAVTRFGLDSDPMETTQVLLPQQLSFAWAKFQQTFGDRLPASHESWWRTHMLKRTKETVTIDATAEIFRSRITALCKKRGYDEVAFKASIDLQQSKPSRKKTIAKEIDTWEKNEEAEDIALSEQIRTFVEKLPNMPEGKKRTEAVQQILTRLIAFQELSFAGRFAGREETEMELVRDSKNESFLPAELHVAWEELRTALIGTKEEALFKGLKYLFWSKQKKEQARIDFTPKNPKPARSGFLHLPKFKPASKRRNLK